LKGSKARANFALPAPNPIWHIHGKLISLDYNLYLSKSGKQRLSQHFAQPPPKDFVIVIQTRTEDSELNSSQA
jgi:hypothetical protein